MQDIYLNGYRYSPEIVELLHMAWLYGSKYTHQFEKFYGDLTYRDREYEDMLSEWEDMEAAVKLLKERYGPEFCTIMSDYTIEVNRKRKEII